MLDKKLSDIFPSINQIFPGKPVQTKFGEGYVLGAKNPEETPEGKPQSLSAVFYVNIKGEVLEVTRNDILADRDQNEIENDLTELKDPSLIEKDESSK